MNQQLVTHQQQQEVSLIQYNSNSEESTPMTSQQQPVTLSKSDLLKWVSTELGFNVSNIQRFQSGTLIVLLIAKAFQFDNGVLTIIQKQASLKAKIEMEFIQNYKLIFKIMGELGLVQIKNSVDVIDKLIKGKVNETIDFIQLVKKLYDQHRQPQTTINQKQLQQIFDEAQIMGIDKDNQKKQLFQDSTMQRLNSNVSNSNKSSVNCENQALFQFDKLLSKSSQVSSDLEHLFTENQELKKVNLISRLKTKTAEKERDFYFGKLRDIELLLIDDKREAVELIRAIQKILYAKEDENIEVDEDGNILV